MDNKKFSVDLYDSIICALTHDIQVCDKCGKCKKNPEDNAATVRLDLIEALANYTGYGVPWEEAD